MNKIEEQFHTLTKETSLTQEERISMRERVEQYMEMKPLRTDTKQVPVRSPMNDFLHFMGAHHLPSALIFAMVMSGAGVSYVAADSLPGDLLYPIKVGVNEEVRTAFTFSDTSEMEWNRERMDRRLEEATQLAVQGKLTGSRKDKVSQLLKEQTERVTQDVRDVEEVDPVLAVAASSELEAALSVHEAVIARAIVEEGSKVSDDAFEFVGQVQAASQEAGKIREDAERIIEESTEKDDQKDDQAGGASTSPNQVAKEDTGATSANLRIRVAYSTRDAARKAVAQARAEFETLNASSSLYANASAQIAVADKGIAKGNALLEEDDYSGAYLAYRESRIISQKVQNSLEAATLFDIDILETEVDEADENASEAESEEMTAEEESVQEVKENAAAFVTQAQQLLLTQQGYPEDISHRANEYIKNALAYELRGNIALVLEDQKGAQNLFKKSFHAAKNAVTILEKAIDDGLVEVVPAIEEEAQSSQEETDSLPVSPPSELSDLPRLDVVQLTHTASGTVHVYSGSFYTPTACFSVVPTMQAENEGRQLTLDLAVEENGGEDCGQAIVEVPFTISVDAHPASELVGVTVNGNLSKYEVREGVEEESTRLPVLLPPAPPVVQ